MQRNNPAYSKVHDKNEYVKVANWRAWYPQFNKRINFWAGQRWDKLDDVGRCRWFSWHITKANCSYNFTEQNHHHWIQKPRRRPFLQAARFEQKAVSQAVCGLWKKQSTQLGKAQWESLSTNSLPRLILRAYIISLPAGSFPPPWKSHDYIHTPGVELSLSAHNEVYT